MCVCGNTAVCLVNYYLKTIKTSETIISDQNNKVPQPPPLSDCTVPPSVGTASRWLKHPGAEAASTGEAWRQPPRATLRQCACAVRLQKNKISNGTRRAAQAVSSRTRLSGTYFEPFGGGGRAAGLPVALYCLLAAVVFSSFKLQLTSVCAKLSTHSLGIDNT